METWFKALQDNCVWCCKAYYKKMEKRFKKIPISKPEPAPQIFKKCQLLLYPIGQNLYVLKINQTVTHLENTCLRKNNHEEEDCIKYKLNKSSDH